MPTCVRELLRSDRTYYVRPDGNDGNDGRSNDAAGAFLTIQHAVDTVADAIDLGGFDVTIQVADGAYDANVTLRPYVGRAANGLGVMLRGNTAAPGNVTIDVTSGACISGFATPPWVIDGLSLSTSSAGTYCVSANRCSITLQSMELRASVQAHVRANSNGEVALLASYAISGGAPSHLRSELASSVFVNPGITVTLTGTPVFAASFVEAVITAIVGAASVTYVGTATGKRYNAALNGVITTNNGGANFFPGSVAGTTATGGHYA
jgi:hypothetical protein